MLETFPSGPDWELIMDQDQRYQYNEPMPSPPVLFNHDEHSPPAQVIDLFGISNNESPSYQISNQILTHQ